MPLPCGFTASLSLITTFHHSNRVKAVYLTLAVLTNGSTLECFFTKLSKTRNRLVMSAFLYACKAQALLFATTLRNIMFSPQLNYEENIMEEYAKLLNTILTKVVFTHMTMFFVFLFSSFYFMPPELAADMNAKTPPFFPDWFPLSALGSVIFTLLSTAAWILLCNGVKLAFTKFRQASNISSESDKLIKPFIIRELDKVAKTHH